MDEEINSIVSCVEKLEVQCFHRVLLRKDCRLKLQLGNYANDLDSSQLTR